MQLEFRLLSGKGADVSFYEHNAVTTHKTWGVLPTLVFTGEQNRLSEEPATAPWRPQVFGVWSPPATAA